MVKVQLIVMWLTICWSYLTNYVSSWDNFIVNLYFKLTCVQQMLNHGFEKN
jgi:hypothetical protein